MTAAQNPGSLNVMESSHDSGEVSSHSGNESITFSKTKPGMLLRPAHVRKTLAKFEESKQSVVVQSGTRKKRLDVEEEPQTQNSFDAKDSTIKGIRNKFEKASSSEPPGDEAKHRFLKPPRVYRSLDSKYDESRRATSVDSGTVDDNEGVLDYSGDTDLPTGGTLCKDDTNNKDISSKSERVLSPEKPTDVQKSKFLISKSLATVKPQCSLSVVCLWFTYLVLSLKLLCLQ